MVAAAVCSTSGGVVRYRISGVCQLLPQSPVHILLHQGIYEKAGESIQGHHRLYKVKAFHVHPLKCILRKENESLEVNNRV